ncbi:MAG: hypothetical protein HYW02_03470 [Deltaproteobacteria bacterium]|nr:hypothetical protein [Deltaproteobacteria bacterium]MBI2500526.1 hypothetical protein [Deltaproteobacteria bacterium]
MIEGEKNTASNPEEMVIHCLSCNAPDLYLQKDFPRKIAIPIILVGIVTVPWTYGISLLVVALIDFILFRRVPWMTVCYRCRAEYRGFRLNPVHKEFDRHLDELYRYR